MWVLCIIPAIIKFRILRNQLKVFFCFGRIKKRLSLFGLWCKNWNKLTYRCIYLWFSEWLISSRYVPERKIVDGATFTVPAGKSVAIVGSSGSGKSFFNQIISYVFVTRLWVWRSLLLIIFQIIPIAENLFLFLYQYLMFL